MSTMNDSETGIDCCHECGSTEAIIDVIMSGEKFKLCVPCTNELEAAGVMVIGAFGGKYSPNEQSRAFAVYDDAAAARDVAHMNRLQRGGYFDLLQMQAKVGPMTLEVIKRVLGKDFEESWTAIAMIMGAEIREDGTYFSVLWLQKQATANGNGKNGESGIVLGVTSLERKRERRKNLEVRDCINTRSRSSVLERDLSESENGINLSSKSEKNQSFVKKCTTFEGYIVWATDEYKKLCQDKVWLLEREKYHPFVDVLLSLEKAFKDFWSTEAGWKNVRKRKGDSVDWKRTYANALSMQMNQVKKNRFPVPAQLDQPVKPAYYQELKTMGDLKR